MADDRYTVIAVDGDTVEVMPHSNGWGGPRVSVPRDMVNGADVVVGSQVRGDVIQEQDGVLAELVVMPLPPAHKVRLQRRGQGWVHEGHSVEPMDEVATTQERNWAAQCGYWLGEETEHFDDLRAHLAAKKEEVVAKRWRQWRRKRTEYRP